MKLSKICSFAALCIAAGAAPSWVAAQEPPAQAPAKDVAPPPPRIENLQEVEAPSVTIQTPSEKREKKITETREQGKVTEVKVEGPNSTYYLRPKTLGNEMPGEAMGGHQTNPQWKIKEFDWGRKPEKKAPSDAMPSQ